MKRKVDRLLSKAKKSLEERDLDKAIALYEKAVEISRGSSDYSYCLFLLASILHDRGDIQKAASLFEELKELYSYERPIALKKLNSIYKKSGDISKRIAILEELSKTQEQRHFDSDCGRTLMELSQVYFELKQYENAERTCSKALKKMGGVWGKKNDDYTKCIEEFVEVLEQLSRSQEQAHLESDCGRTLLKLSQIYLELEQYENAERTCLKALEKIEGACGKKNDDYIKCIEKLVEIHRESGRGEKEIESLEELQDIYALNERYDSCYKTLCELLRRYEKGTEQYEITFAKRDNISTRLEKPPEAIQESREFFYKGNEKAFDVFIINRSDLGAAYPDVTLSLLQSAVNYYSSGDYERTRKICLDLCEKYSTMLEKDHNSCFKIKELLGLSNLRLGNYRVAEELFTELLREEDSGLRRKDLRVNLYQYLGDLYYSKQDLKRARDNYTEGLKLLKEAEESTADPFAITRFYNSIGNVYLDTGSIREAIRLYQKALGIRLEVFGKESHHVAVCMHNLADAYLENGDYDKAIKYSEGAIDLRRKVLGDDHPDFASSICHLAWIYFEIGQYEMVLKMAKKASAILSEKPDITINSGLLSLWAWTCYLIKDFTRAFSYTKSLQDFLRTTIGEKNHNFAMTRNLLGCVFNSTGHLEEAINELEESIRIYTDIGEGNCIDSAIGRDNLGDALSNNEDYERAIEEHNRAREIKVSVLGEDHPYVAISLRNLGLVYVCKGELENALYNFLQALESSNRFILLRGHMESSVSKFIEDDARISESLLSTLVSLGSSAEKKEEAYEALLNAKVIGYQVAMNVYLSILSGNHPQLSEKFDLLCIKRAEYSNLILKNPTGAKEREEALLEEIDSLERELAIEIPELETDIESRIVSLEKMRGSIPESSVLLDFYHYREVILGEKKRPEFGKGKYGLFKVKREGELELIDLGYSDEIDEKIKVFREEIVPKSEMTSKEREKGLETVKQLAGELFDSLISKALTNEKIERIMISPDGMLNFLPFETLVSENKYLVEEFKITYLSSPKDIVRFNNIKGNGTKDIHIYSHPDYDFNFPGGEKPEKDIEPPETKGMTIKSLREKGLEFKSLEFSGKYEVDSISRAAEGTSLNLKDPKTKEAAHEHSIREIKKPTILHISTHGFFLDKEKKKPELMELQTFGEMGPMIRYDDPLKRSGLVLAGVNRVIKGEPVCEEVEDGILTAYDIVSLDIYGAELVVLSACDTGIGEIKTGQGVMGFRRSFTLAGVKTLVMSLWEVPTNETAILMENFYDNLFRGKGKADSLREAQLKMMKEDYDDPYYWGAFIVQGENNIIRTPEEISSDWQ